MVTLKQLPRSFVLALLIASAAMLGACEEEGAAEKAGKKIDAAAESAGEKAEEAAEAAKEAMEDAEEKAKEATK
jgi:hyperosmotically inducible protein